MAAMKPKGMKTSGAMNIAPKLAGGAGSSKPTYGTPGMAPASKKDANAIDSNTRKPAKRYK